MVTVRRPDPRRPGTSPRGGSPDPATVHRQVRDHLLLNFTDLGDFADADVPVIVRGDGCHVVDLRGRRFIDGISGLFCTNLGHGFGDRERGTGGRRSGRRA